MTNRLRPIICVALAALLQSLAPSALGQGCVAARGAGVCNIHGVHTDDDAKWDASIGYRWLNSDRHFVGDHEERQRKAQGSEVINNSNYIDATIAYNITPRYSAEFTVPFVIHDRSQTIVVSGVRQRYHTASSGISDVRLGGHMWIMDPVASERKWNIRAGLTLDAPTGEKDARDIFPVVVAGVVTAQTRTVDQSIQPGDGGWGFTPDIYAYYKFTDKLTGFVHGAYSITPEEDNGVPTFRTRPTEAIMSIADAYFGRLGAEYKIYDKWDLTVSLANRIEGVPVYDLVGGSDWFRRPGYSISLEPGIMANVNGWRLAMYVPFAYYNNRERSVPDIQSGTTAAGLPVEGDAAFADYQILFSIGRSF